MGEGWRSRGEGSYRNTKIDSSHSDPAVSDDNSLDVNSKHRSSRASNGPSATRR